MVSASELRKVREKMQRVIKVALLLIEYASYDMHYTHIHIPKELRSDFEQGDWSSISYLVRNHIEFIPTIPHNGVHPTFGMFKLKKGS